MKHCFLIGHHDAPPALYPYVFEAVERHITRYAVDHFMAGSVHYFDSMACNALREAKKKYPNITIEVMMPYSPCIIFPEVPEGFDGIYFPERLEIVADVLRLTEANRKAVERSDYVIAYMQKESGRTVSAVEFALSYEKTVTFLPQV